jgi:Holliday junction resolvase RusA-like endonuclease
VARDGVHAARVHAHDARVGAGEGPDEVMSSTLRFIVPGIAQTKGSMKAFIPKGWNRAILTNDNPKAKAWAQLIAEHAGHALAESKLQPFGDGPVLLDIWFYLPRPQKFLIPKYADVDVPHTTRPDADKLLRCAKDSLSKVVWRDDAMVVDAYAHKRYCRSGELPRAEITVRSVAWDLPKPVRHADTPSLFGEEALYAAQEV